MTDSRPCNDTEDDTAEHAGDRDRSDEAVLRRVRKLLDKAERTSNEHEAEAFARKAADLVARHRIDPDRLVAGDLDDLEIRRVPLGRGAYVRARLNLLHGVADAHDVAVVFESTPSGTVAMLAGYRTDLDVTEVMYQSLHQQAAARMADIHRGSPAATQRYRRSFLMGFGHQVWTMLLETRRAAEAQVAPRVSAETALAVRGRKVAVQEFMRAQFGRVTRARPPARSIASGWDAGAAAATRADVGRSRLEVRPAIGRGA